VPDRITGSYTTTKDMPVDREGSDCSRLRPNLKLNGENQVKNESISPELDPECEDVEDERTDEERYRAALSEVYELSLDGQRILDLKFAKPEHTLLILEDCLKKIEDLCSI